MTRRFAYRAAAAEHVLMTALIVAGLVIWWSGRYALWLAFAPCAIIFGATLGRDGRSSAAFRVGTLPGLRHLKRRRAALRLRNALVRGEIIPFYQPIVDLRCGTLQGFECLARWDDPLQGMRTPDSFIPLAEETGLLDELTLTLLSQACRDMLSWPEDVTLSINLAPPQLRQPHIPAAILAHLAASGIAPSRLIVEITETGLVEDVVAARAFIGTLKRQGVRIALDDFGVGYSSLRHLAGLPVDVMKIDRHFVAELHVRENFDIVRMMMTLAQGFGLSVTAEGIEHAEQARQLVELGCTHGQGYLFSVPIRGEIASRIAQAEDTQRRAASN